MLEGVTLAGTITITEFIEMTLIEFGRMRSSWQCSCKPQNKNERYNWSRPNFTHGNTSPEIPTNDVGELAIKVSAGYYSHRHSTYGYYSEQPQLPDEAEALEPPPT